MLSFEGGRTRMAGKHSTMFYHSPLAHTYGTVRSSIYGSTQSLQVHPSQIIQVIKTFSMREGWWYIGIKGGGGVKSKGTRIVIEKEKRNRPILAACRHV